MPIIQIIMAILILIGLDIPLGTVRHFGIPEILDLVALGIMPVSAVMVVMASMVSLVMVFPIGFSIRDITIDIPICTANLETTTMDTMRAIGFMVRLIMDLSAQPTTILAHLVIGK